MVGHVCSLVATNGGMVVAIAGEGREIPEAKHSSWVQTRAPLDCLKSSEGLQEVLLSREGPKGRELLEGLTSNVFIVRKGVIQTSGEAVLRGHIRELCLEACKALGLELVYEPPLLSESHLWDEAFITSTSRIATSIATIHFAADMAGSKTLQSQQSASNNSTRVLTLAEGEGPVTARVRLKVVEMVREGKRLTRLL
ncbi:unnamed protein product [Chrysoparadoxa australica]